MLVNNAAHSTRDGFEALDAATIDAHFAVNVRAPMLLSVLLARAGRPGRIVNLVSGQFLGPMPGELAYTASKGALEAFTRQLAAEVAHLGITVNAVGPGPNDTGWIDDDIRAELLPRFPMGRVGTPGGRRRARGVAVLGGGRLGHGPGHPLRGRLPALGSSARRRRRMRGVVDAPMRCTATCDQGGVRARPSIVSGQTRPPSERAQLPAAADTPNAHNTPQLLTPRCPGRARRRGGEEPQRR